MLKVLIKVRLQAWLASFISPRTRLSINRRKPANPVLRSIGYGVLFVYLIGVFGFLSYTNFSTLAAPLHAAGVDWLYWALAGASVFGVVFLMSLLMAPSQLYQAKDTEMLLAMPIKESDILASRIFGLWLTDLVFEAIIVVPAIICYRHAAVLTAAGILGLVVGLTLLPLAALAIACLAGYGITLVTSKVRNKTLFSVVFTLLFIAIYYYASFNAPQLLMTLAADASAISGRLAGVYPLYWLGRSIAAGSLADLGWLTLVCLVPTALIYQWLVRSFIPIVLSLTDVKTPHKAYKGGPMTARSVDRTLVGKELQRLMSSANYLINGCLGLAFLLAGTVYMVIIRHQIYDVLAEQFGVADSLGALMVVVFICGILMTVTVSSSSISLEGKNIWLLRSLPVSSGAVLRAKAGLQMWITIPFVAVAAVTAALVLGADLATAAVMLALPLLFAALTAMLGVIINLRHPRFDWINEVQVIKQSWAVGLTMIIDLALVLAIALPYFLWLADRGWTPTAYMALWSAVLALGALGAYRWLMTRGARAFERLG